MDLDVGNLRVKASLVSRSVSMLSSQCYDKLSPKPPKVREERIYSYLALDGETLPAFAIEPIEVRLGDKCFLEKLYVARENFSC